MKYLLIALMSLTANGAILKDPTFYKGEKVIYRTGYFLHKVCSGKGTIYEYNTDTQLYTVQTPSFEADCPAFVTNLKESDMKDNEK